MDLICLLLKLEKNKKNYFNNKKRIPIIGNVAVIDP